MVRKSIEVNEKNRITGGYPPSVLKKPIRLTKLRDAQRLLSRLITEFQTGSVDSQWAKSLCYLVISYVQVARDVEMEARIEDLERQIENMKTQNKDDRWNGVPV